MKGAIRSPAFHALAQRIKEHPYCEPLQNLSQHLSDGVTRLKQISAGGAG